MNKKLPKVFQNKIDKDVSNNNKFYYSVNKTNESDVKENLNKKEIKPKNINK